MLVSVKGFIYHKTAENFSDCFDRYGVNASANKFAISDGITTSFFSDIWAEQLIDFYIRNDIFIDFDYLKSKSVGLQEEWHKRVKAIADKPNQKYYVRNAFNLGKSAGATFVGLQFFKAGRGLEWRAIAVGDSFLFFAPDISGLIPAHLDNFNRVSKIPSTGGFEFSNYPDFLCSRGELLKGSVEHKSDYLSPGTFYLMTDALAEWFISQKQTAIDIISEWRSQSDFEKSMAFLRCNDLKNDDAAILIIKVEQDYEDVINYKDILLTDINEQIKKQHGNSI